MVAQVMSACEFNLQALGSSGSGGAVGSKILQTFWIRGNDLVKKSWNWGLVAEVTTILVTSK
jgi:hypothetical protein